MKLQLEAQGYRLWCLGFRVWGFAVGLIGSALRANIALRRCVIKVQSVVSSGVS